MSCRTADDERRESLHQVPGTASRDFCGLLRKAGAPALLFLLWAFLFETQLLFFCFPVFSCIGSCELRFRRMRKACHFCWSAARLRKRFRSASDSHPVCRIRSSFENHPHESAFRQRDGCVSAGMRYMRLAVLPEDPAIHKSRKVQPGGAAVRMSSF